MPRDTRFRRYRIRLYCVWLVFFSTILWEASSSSSRPLSPPESLTSSSSPSLSPSPAVSGLKPRQSPLSLSLSPSLVASDSHPRHGTRQQSRLLPYSPTYSIFLCRKRGISDKSCNLHFLSWDDLRWLHTLWRWSFISPINDYVYVDPSSSCPFTSVVLKSLIDMRKGFFLSMRDFGIPS